MYWHLLWKYIYSWTFISRKNEKEGENKKKIAVETTAICIKKSMWYCLQQVPHAHLQC